jgi:hypothetical protein
MEQHEKMTLIGFRAPESLRERIEAERIALNLSNQELLRKAIEHYLVNRQTTPHPDVTQATESAERFKLTTLWQSYVREMPTEKIELMVHVMEMDLQHYRSSRRLVKRKQPTTPVRRRRSKQGPNSDAEKV